MKYKIIKNPNDKVYDALTKALEKADFCCPCFLERDISTEEGKRRICICENFRNMVPNLYGEELKDGDGEVYGKAGKREVACMCHCKRYLKVAIPETEEEKQLIDDINKENNNN